MPSQEWGKTAKIYVALQEHKQQLSAEVTLREQIACRLLLCRRQGSQCISGGDLRCERLTGRVWRQETSKLVEQDAQLKQQLSDQQSLLKQVRFMEDVPGVRCIIVLRSSGAAATRNGGMYAELQAVQISLSLEEATQRITALQPQVCV